MKLGKQCVKERVELVPFLCIVIPGESDHQESYGGKPWKSCHYSDQKKTPLTHKEGPLVDLTSNLVLLCELGYQRE